MIPDDAEPLRLAGGSYETVDARDLTRYCELPVEADFFAST
jgi:hypothetical protein